VRVVTTYDPVRVTAAKTVECSVCGKKLRRQRTFQQTISPFNKNPDGTQKTSREVYLSVCAVAEDWKREPEQCSSH
jgi:hypothetical protein